MSAYMAVLAAAVAPRHYAPSGKAQILIALAFGACGFLVYGPLMMVSVAAAGYAGPELAGTASGLGGLCGYIGATLAGAGIGAAAEHAGWGTVFAILVGASLASALCFALTIFAPAPKDDTTIMKSTRAQQLRKLISERPLIAGVGAATRSTRA